MNRERLEPTHMLRIDIPLNMSDPPTEYDAVKQALDLALAISRAAYDKVICNDIQVTMHDA